MQSVSTLWNDYFNSLNRKIEYKVDIGTDVYYNENLYSIRVHSSLCGDDVFSLGKVVAKKLDITIKPKATPIPKMANVDLFVRFNGDLGPTEWIPKGKFYIDTRQKSDNKLILECYDKALMMERPFLQDETPPDFPMLMTDALDVICTRLSLTLENPEDISSTLSIEYPNELTMRDVAGYIASGNGGNFIITDTGSLRLVRPSNPASIGSVSYKNFDEINDVWQISRVTMYYDDENYFTSGDDTSDELIINNPWATQDMCDNVLSLLSGYVHNPYTCQGAYINPAAELGDAVTMGDFTGVIYTADVKYGGNITWDISSPGESVLEHEYPYEGSYSKAIKNRVGLDNEYYGVTIGRRDGLKIVKTDGENETAEAVFNTDTLAMRAKENGVMKDKIYFDPVEGTYVFDGKLSATSIEALQSLVAGSIYTDKANIAEITVDRLETSNKVLRYIHQDPSPINFIRVYEQNIEFINGFTDGAETEQIRDRKGALLYWENGDFKSTTTEITDYPVLVYKYDEQKKMKLLFDSLDDDHIPQIELGIGDGTGPLHGQGIIRKETDGVFLKYYSRDSGDLRYIKIGDDGIEMFPAIIQYAETKNFSSVTVGTTDQFMGILGATTTSRTRMVVNTHLNGTPSTDLTATLIVKLDGVQVYETSKQYQSGKKDQMLFTGILPVRSAGLSNVEIFLKTNTGTLEIGVEEFQAYMEIRGGLTEEVPPYPEINVKDLLVLNKVQDNSCEVVFPSNEDNNWDDSVSLDMINNDNVEVILA